MSYASGDAPLTLGHYVCIHCDSVEEVTSENHPLPKCKCAGGKGTWVERPVDENEPS